MVGGSMVTGVQPPTADGTHRFAVESVDRRDVVVFAGGQAGQIEGHFDRLCPAVAEKSVLEVARGTHGDQFGQVASQGVYKILTVQGSG